MAYATPDDLGSSGLPEGWLTAVSVPDQMFALEAASDFVDSYLAARYTVPLTSWGHDIRRAVCHITSWDLLTRRGFDPENPADKAIRTRYEDIIKWLEAIAAGKLTPSGVVDATPDDDSDDAGGAIVYTNPRRGVL